MDDPDIGESIFVQWVKLDCLKVVFKRIIVHVLSKGDVTFQLDLL